MVLNVSENGVENTMPDKEKVPGSDMKEESVLTVIKSDHEKTSKEIKQLEAVKPGDAAANNMTFTGLQKELLGHMHAEEKLVFPLITNDEKELIKDALEEHKKIRDSLKKLSKGPIGTPAWLDELKTMKKTIEHHVKEEEGPIFTAIRKKVDAATLQRLGPQFKLEEKKE